MNKKLIYELGFTYVFAVIGVFMMQINVFVVLAAVCVTSYIFSTRGEHDVEERMQFENRKLENKINSSSKDAHLIRKQLYTLANNIPLPLLLIDEKGEILLYNERCDSLRTGGTTIKNYLENDFFEDVHNFIHDAYIVETSLDRTMTIGMNTYEGLSAPFTSNKHFAGCVILFQDITKVQEKEDMQKQFIADASHELKTPIAAIKGMVEILNREDFDDKAIEKDFLIQIEKENLRLEEIVMDLLTLSRFNRNVVILKRRLQDFTEICDTSIQSLKSEAEEKGIEIIRDYHSHDQVFVDDKQMLIVVNNLLNNAIKYSKEGEIILRTYSENEHYYFQISDHGYGIALEDIDKIFERFYRVNKDRSRYSGGSGLGLPIVKSICDAHNAKISVESEIGKGSVFTIEFN